MRLWFVHGWGWDACFWDSVCAALPASLNAQCCDFGYFNQARQFSPDATPDLIVAHSYGVLWSLMHGYPTPNTTLLAINGFPKLAATIDYPGVAPRVLARMQRRFTDAPQAVLAEFQQTCAAPASAPAPAKADWAKLGHDLSALAQQDARMPWQQRRENIHLLWGEIDPIVPSALSHHLAAGLPPAHAHSVSGGGHLLPLTHPGRCAEAIIQRCAQQKTHPHAPTV